MRSMLEEETVEFTLGKTFNVQVLTSGEAVVLRFIFTDDKYLDVELDGDRTDCMIDALQQARKITRGDQDVGETRPKYLC